MLDHIRPKLIEHAFVSEFSRQSPTAMQLWTWHNKFKEEGCLFGEKDLDDKEHQKRRSSVFVKNHAKPNEIVAKNKSGNPDSTNNRLAHPEETLDNEALQATTRSGHNGRGQAKAQT